MTIIVIVDDVPRIIDNLSKVLKSAEFEVMSVHVTKQTTLQSVVEQIPIDSVVLLDEEMHSFTGSNVAEALQSSGFTGVIISTTGAKTCPSHYKHWFNGKYELPNQGWQQ